MRLSVACLTLAVTLPVASFAPAQSEDVKSEAPAPVKEKLICRREVPIGSLIASRKTCMTKLQWAKAERDGNEAGRRMVEDNRPRFGLDPPQ